MDIFQMIAFAFFRKTKHCTLVQECDDAAQEDIGHDVTPRVTSLQAIHTRMQTLKVKTRKPEYKK